MLSAALLAVIATTPMPSFRAAASAATVVAYGQIERVEMKDGQRVVTMAVEHVAKGHVGKKISLIDLQGSLELRSRALVFLERDEKTSTLRVLFEGAGLVSAVRRAATVFVQPSKRVGVQIPKTLCQPGVGCRLPEVLKSVGLFTPPVFDGGVEATFRNIACAPCQLEKAMRALNDEVSVDCSADGGDDARRACVERALATGRNSTVPVAGIDSLLMMGFVKRGERISRFWYDSSGAGGSGCTGFISLSECSALDRGSDLLCLDGGVARVICSEQDDVWLEDAQPVANLKCEFFLDGAYVLCDGDSRDGGFVRPRSDGPNYVCDSVGLQYCSPE